MAWRQIAVCLLGPCWLTPAPARAEPAAPQLAVGTVHTCAVSDGQLWCWGQNGNGQLGDGSQLDQATPRAVAIPQASVASVAAGGHHTCALKTNGALWCWGHNGSGELGDGTVVDRPLPTPVTALGADVAEVAAGWSHTCARKTDGTLWCWGSNADGRLGDGTTQNRVTPTQVSALGTSVAQVAAGVAHTCARQSDNSLWCWGYNGVGAIGDLTTQSRSLPTLVSSLGSDVVEVATGAHTCARSSDNRLWCWGWNQYGQLGDGSNFNRVTPYEVSNLLGGVTQVSLGWRHSCALKTDGKLRCWGYNADGELGDGTTFNRAFPVLSSLSASVPGVAAGDSHSCARRADGGIWCSGLNLYGQLGLGDHSDRKSYAQVTFPPVPPPAVAASVPAGRPFLLALLALGLACLGVRSKQRLRRPQRV